LCRIFANFFLNTGLTNITGLSLSELQIFVSMLGEKPYRASQLFHWLYRERVSSFDEMTSLSKSFRSLLNSIAAIEQIQLVSSRVSRSDETTKFLFRLSDRTLIESVLIPSPSFECDEEQKYRSRFTLCVSTQVGCPLDCKFCATGTMGLTRNLSTSEIVNQVLFAEQWLQRKNNEQTLTNVVFMGMGEPLLNFENVLKSIEIFSTGMQLSAKHITVSTAGHADGIRKLADEKCKAKLAISLHTLDNSFRKLLMPITKKYSVDDVISAAEYYYAKTKQRITFEYIVFEGKNNLPTDVIRLSELVRRVPSKINIIPFHSIAFTGVNGLGTTLQPPVQQKFEQFVQELRDRCVTVFVRSSAGEDIEAACGQLAITSSERVTSKKFSANTLPYSVTNHISFSQPLIHV